MRGVEWDNDTAAVNLRDHGLSLVDAAAACRDPFAVDWMDMRQDYGEERSILLGLCRRTVPYVAYTERGDNVRMISARRATKHEQNDYYRQNAP